MATSRKRGMENENGAPKIRFRNYRPQDKKLKVETVKVPLPKPLLDDAARSEAVRAEKENGPTPYAKKNDNPEIEDPIQREIAAHQKEQGGDDLINIAPKKPNWDLKRDVMKKMEKLNRRTQMAIVELIKERIEREAAEESSEEESDESSEEEET
uniref:Coiled-coil domain-containing protein 12 n=1 Tax=Octactis speculum TaxID=3111310 RepID=A0A7S2GKY8_9STRA|mmetsp:Transcript_49057/g.66844  ORF Transcript_49057/g.66844 Transcript_49057/m.66844 type:complete len:155 (+) Transcript_49057:12-476(+)|eukprot:CAMPEP_0185767934 /NCGR_PEP_ID=MMETSP1174-20130828/45856_1 /TAXON_ID=35687 /ORGANISM="Dictyocha speculum, Strain CCMP1381" /LENGTH=154 /DNA_ID=CAMNT_0028452329 /DNA_START=12 /DNA_END=476 /DNA_ORIENTATION=+